MLGVQFYHASLHVVQNISKFTTLTLCYSLRTEIYLEWNKQTRKPGGVLFSLL